MKLRRSRNEVCRKNRGDEEEEKGRYKEKKQRRDIKGQQWN